MLGVLFDTSFFNKPFIKSEAIADAENLAYFSLTAKVHAGLLNAMVERGKSIIVVTPSDRADFLHLLALEALFRPKVPDRDVVFLLSSNTEFRERFRQLAPKLMRPPHDKARYAREEPLSPT